MKKGITLIILIFVILVLVTQGIHFVRGANLPVNILSDSTVNSSTRFFIETVDSANDTGQYISVAIDQDSSDVYVSYYDNTEQNLRSATYVGSGGNCGVDNSWKCRTMDQVGDVGKYTSIAVNPQNSHIGIAYHDYDERALQYTTGACYGSSCLWSLSTIDTGSSLGNDYDGLYNSLVYQSDGRPAIAYYTSKLTGDDFLRVATYVGSGGNCGQDSAAGKWDCQIVASGNKVGKFASLALDSAEDRHIAYYDGGNDSLMYANSIGGSYNSFEILPKEAGQYASLAVDTDHGDVRHIAHYDGTNNKLEYAKYVGSGGNGNCGFDSSSTKFLWQCDEIDDMGPDPYSPRGLDIAVDNAGYPIIVYGANYTLKIARPVAALGLLVGNCGPVDLFYTWQCDTIAQSRVGQGQANYVSLAVNSAGLGTIAYYGDFSSSSNNNGDMKIAYQQLHLYLPLVTKK
jgi:hypothetical protein